MTVNKDIKINKCYATLHTIFNDTTDEYVDVISCLLDTSDGEYVVDIISNNGINATTAVNDYMDRVDFLDEAMELKIIEENKKKVLGGTNYNFLPTDVEFFNLSKALSTIKPEPKNVSIYVGNDPNIKPKETCKTMLKPKGSRKAIYVGDKKTGYVVCYDV